MSTPSAGPRPSVRPGTPDEYLTVEEFAALPSDAHHAVWRAHAERRIDSVPVSVTPGSVLRYRRAGVRDVLREMEERRG